MRTFQKYQRVTSDLNPPNVIEVKEVMNGNPRVFTGLFEDGDVFKCRYIWGMLTVYKYPLGQSPKALWCIYREQLGDELDGYMLYDDLRVALVDTCYLPKHYTNFKGEIV